MLDAADATEASEAVLALLEGQTLTDIDYIQTADQTGVTIPEFSFGRKGVIPYFGNNPIQEGSTIRFDETFVAPGGLGRVLIGSIPLTAAQMQVGSLWLSFDLLLTVSDVAANKWALWMDFGTSASPSWAATGSYFLMGGEILAQFILKSGMLNLNAFGPSGLSLDLGYQTINKITDSESLLVSDLGNGAGEGLGVIGVADSIKFYLAAVNTTAAQNATLVGSITVIQ